MGVPQDIHRNTRERIEVTPAAIIRQPTTVTADKAHGKTAVVAGQLRGRGQLIEVKGEFWLLHGGAC